MIADHPDRHRYILDVDGHQAAEVVYRMIPTCDYLQGWLRKHPDYLELVAGPRTPCGRITPCPPPQSA